MTEATQGGDTRPAEDFSPTARTTLRRLPKRGSFERQTVYEILDDFREWIAAKVGRRVAHPPPTGVPAPAD